VPRQASPAASRRSCRTLAAMNSKRTDTSRPLWLGFIVAPLSAPLLYALWHAFFFVDASPKQEASEAYPLVMAFVFVPASYVASLAVGLPLVLVLRRAKILTFWSVASLALPLGAAAMTLAMLCMWLVSDQTKGNVWPFLAGSAGIGAILAFAVAAVFCWVVGIPGRSRKHEHPEQSNGG